MRQKTQVERTCEHCGNTFQIHAYRIKNGTGKFCGQACYLAHRWGKKQPCKNCGKESEYRFCNEYCRQDYWNKNSFAIHKKPRNWEKKFALINELGGKCVICGETDYRVLDIDHIDPSTKLLERKKSGNWINRFKDWESNKGNLRLLCANCHRIHTWEQMGYCSHIKDS